MTRPARRPGVMRRRLARCGVALAVLLGTVATTSAQENPSTAAPTESPPNQIQTPDGGDATEGGLSSQESDVALFDSPRLMYATTSARIRSGPGTAHGPVGTIPFAGSVTVLGEMQGGGWLYLQMADGTRGYTAARLLSGSPPAPSGGEVTDSGVDQTGVDQTGGTSVPSSGIPVCISGETLIQLGSGQAICAVLQ